MQAVILLLISTRSPISLFCTIKFDMYIELKQTEKRFHEHWCLLQNVLAFFWASCYCPLHCLAADLGAGVEQPFDYLIVQNSRAMQSMWSSMDWTLEDNMVDLLFFCATLTGRRGRHAPLYIRSRRGPKVARRPWAPRTVLEFAIKTRYVLDSWKTSCCP